MKKLLFTLLLVPTLSLFSAESYEWKIDHDTTKWHIGHRAKEKRSCKAEYFKEGENPSHWTELVTMHAYYDFPEDENAFLDVMEDAFKKQSVEVTKTKLNTHPESTLLEFNAENSAGEKEHTWLRAQKKGNDLYVLFYATKGSNSVREQFFTEAALVPAKTPQNKSYPFIDNQIHFSTMVPSDWNMSARQTDKGIVHRFMSPDDQSGLDIEPPAASLNTWKQFFVEKGGSLIEQGQISLSDGTQTPYFIYSITPPGMGPSKIFLTSIKKGTQEKIVKASASQARFNQDLPKYKAMTTII